MQEVPNVSDKFDIGFVTNDELKFIYFFINVISSNRASDNSSIVVEICNCICMGVKMCECDIHISM